MACSSGSGGKSETIEKAAPARAPRTRRRTQTDDKGSYPTGTVYFNPPGSGHAIRDNSGFFLLAYASPPDFMKTDSIESYTPIRIDTRANVKEEYSFEQKEAAIATFAPALEASCGMSAIFVSTSSSDAYTLQANYLTVIDGACVVDCTKHNAGMLVVTKSIAPQPFMLAADGGDAWRSACRSRSHLACVAVVCRTMPRLLPAGPL